MMSGSFTFFVKSSINRSDCFCIGWLISTALGSLCDYPTVLFSSLLPSPIKSVEVNKSTEGASLVFARMSLSLYQNCEPWV